MATTETRDGAQPGARRLSLTVPDDLTRGLAEAAANFLASLGEADQVFKIVASGNGEDGGQGSVVLPQVAVDLLTRLLTDLGRGNAVVVETVQMEITANVGGHFLDFEPKDREKYDRGRKARICPASRLPQRLSEGRQYDGARTATITQFMRDFSTGPQFRDYMVVEPPPSGGDPTDLALTAAAVHALCDYYDHPVPDWVYGIRAPQEVTMTGIPADTEYGKYIKSQAPPACSEHGVYFEKLMIIPKEEMLRQAGMSPWA